jgi:hypothetical protein
MMKMKKNDLDDIEKVFSVMSTDQLMIQRDIAQIQLSMINDILDDRTEEELDKSEEGQYIFPQSVDYLKSVGSIERLLDNLSAENKERISMFLILTSFISAGGREEITSMLIAKMLQEHVMPQEGGEKNSKKK